MIEPPALVEPRALVAHAWHVAAAPNVREGSRTGDRSEDGNHEQDGGRELDLSDRRVMVCEDEVLVAYDIAAAVEEAGGEVIGPFATVKEALATLDTTKPDMAVLDVNLLDDDVTPVLERLVAASVPVVVNTGTKIPDTAAAANVPVFIKPTEPTELLAALATP